MSVKNVGHVFRFATRGQICGLASGVSGEAHHVGAGFRTGAKTQETAPDIALV